VAAPRRNTITKGNILGDIAPAMRPGGCAREGNGSQHPMPTNEKRFFWCFSNVMGAKKLLLSKVLSKVSHVHDPTLFFCGDLR
jgi:hypothetical protein